MTNELIGEVLGTALLVLLGNGVVAGVVLDKSKAKDAGWIVITIGWGLAVAMAAFVSGLLGPAHLNPAVSIAMALQEISHGLLWSLTFLHNLSEPLSEVS